MVSDWVKLFYQFWSVGKTRKNLFLNAICDPFQKSWNSMKMVNKNYLAQQMTEKIIKKV